MMSIFDRETPAFFFYEFRPVVSFRFALCELNKMRTLSVTPTRLFMLVYSMIDLG